MTTLKCPHCSTELGHDELGELLVRTAEAGEVLALYCTSCRAPLGYLRLALPTRRLE